jgi:RNA polymerase sigma-70 factor (ECF subfamily)
VAFLRNITASPLSDAELVQAFKQSADLNVLGRLYERYMDLVYGVCLNYLKDSERAKDSVLQIFEELILKVQRHDIENFKPWLYQLTKNYCLMQLRSDKKFIKVPADISLMQKEESVHLNGELEGEENQRALQQCLGQLNSEQRQAVELFYLQGKSYKEIAPLMGIDVNSVRSFLQNGRRNLKICMDKKTTVT